MYGHLDPSDHHRVWDDFDTFTAGSWTATITGTGTTALTAGDGGLIASATTGASGDANYLQKTTEGFSFEAGKPMWFKARLKTSLLSTVIVVGLQVTDTTPEDVTDGVYFLSTVTTGALTLYVRKDATTGSTTASAGTLVADTFTELAWYYDGKGNVEAFQDGVKVATVTGVTSSTYLPDATTTISFGIRTTTAAVKTLTIDYLFAAKARR
jgi:hypothetical protein